MNATVDLKKLAAEYGFPSGLEGSENPKFRYAGGINVAMTSWIDPASKQLLRESVRSTFHVTLRGVDLPADDRFPRGKLRFVGTETLELDRLT